MEKPNRIKGFLLYNDYITPVSKLSDAAAGRLFKAILAYVNKKELPELGQVEDMVFCFIKSKIDINNEEYAKRCAINAANGAKGGRPRKSDSPQPTEKETHPVEIVIEPKAEKIINTVESTQVQKKKEQKPPKIHYAEFVTMTEAENARLIERYGENAVQRMVEILDNYKGQNKRRYASDYRAILNWVVGRYQQEQEQEKYRQRKPISISSQTKEDTDADWENFYREGYSK